MKIYYDLSYNFCNWVKNAHTKIRIRDLLAKAVYALSNELSLMNLDYLIHPANLINHSTGLTYESTVHN